MRRSLSVWDLWLELCLLGTCPRSNIRTVQLITHSERGLNAGRLYHCCRPASNLAECFGADDRLSSNSDMQLFRSIVAAAGCTMRAAASLTAQLTRRRLSDLLSVDDKDGPDVYHGAVGILVHARACSTPATKCTSRAPESGWLSMSSVLLAVPASCPQQWSVCCSAEAVSSRAARGE